MALDFQVKDVMHRIVVKFIHAFLPEAKKPYNLKAVHQPELGIHEIASKADVYNISVSPKVIEDGMTAGMELMYYLAADGYRLKTPVFNLKIRVPGEYDGSETRLPEGVFPVARLQISAAFRKYLKERTQIVVSGKDESDGVIAQATDEATDLIDEVATVGNLLTIRGFGLKIEGDETRKDEVGLFFEQEGGAPGNAGAAVKADIIAVNEPRTVKVIVPALEAGKQYFLKIVTQSSAKGGGTLLKAVREIRSDFTLTPQN